MLSFSLICLQMSVLSGCTSKNVSSKNGWPSDNYLLLPLFSGEVLDCFQETLRDKHVAISLAMFGRSTSLSLSKDPLSPLPGSLLETKELSLPLGPALRKFTPVTMQKAAPLRKCLYALSHIRLYLR